MSSRFFKISRIRDVGSFGRNVFQLWQRRGRGPWLDEAQD